MTAEELLNSEQSFICNRVPGGCRMLKTACVSRQAKAQKHPLLVDIRDFCLECELGKQIAKEVKEMQTNKMVSNVQKEPVATQKCRECGDEKPLTPEYFHRDGDGWKRICRECISNRRKARKEAALHGDVIGKYDHFLRQVLDVQVPRMHHMIKAIAEAEYNRGRADAMAMIRDAVDGYGKGGKA